MLLNGNFESGRPSTVSDVSDPTDGVTESMSNKYFYYVDSWDVDTMYPGLEDVSLLQSETM